MARPLKHTVDYFPHSCKHGKTMFIIENKYGNDGYAFWFKLLELLGATNNHVYDCRNPEAWEYLLALTRVDDDIGNGILSTLSTLEAIDRDLWEEKIIWCQNLVNNIADVYVRRKVSVPIKPVYANSNTPNTPTDGFPPTEIHPQPHYQGVSGSSNPQSKVKETKLDKSKVYKSIEIGDNALFHAIEESFISQIKDMETYDYPKERRHIKLLVKKAESKEDPYKYMKEVVTCFYELTEGNDSFWKGQPFLPSTLNSSGLYPRVIKAVENAKPSDDLKSMMEEELVI